MSGGLDCKLGISSAGSVEFIKCGNGSGEIKFEGQAGLASTWAGISFEGSKFNKLSATRLSAPNSVIQFSAEIPNVDVGKGDVEAFNLTGADGIKTFHAGNVVLNYSAVPSFGQIESFEVEEKYKAGNFSNSSDAIKVFDVGLLDVKGEKEGVRALLEFGKGDFTEENGGRFRIGRISNGYNIGKDARGGARKEFVLRFKDDPSDNKHLRVDWTKLKVNSDVATNDPSDLELNCVLDLVDASSGVDDSPRDFATSGATTSIACKTLSVNPKTFSSIRISKPTAKGKFVCGTLAASADPDDDPASLALERIEIANGVDGAGYWTSSPTGERHVSSNGRISDEWRPADPSPGSVYHTYSTSVADTAISAPKYAWVVKSVSWVPAPISLEASNEYASGLEGDDRCRYDDPDGYPRSFLANEGNPGDTIERYVNFKEHKDLKDVYGWKKDAGAPLSCPDDISGHSLRSPGEVYGSVNTSPPTDPPGPGDGSAYTQTGYAQVINQSDHNSWIKDPDLNPNPKFIDVETEGGADHWLAGQTEQPDDPDLDTTWTSYAKIGPDEKCPNWRVQVTRYKYVKLYDWKLQCYTWKKVGSNYVLDGYNVDPVVLELEGMKGVGYAQDKFERSYEKGANTRYVLKNLLAADVGSLQSLKLPAVDGVDAHGCGIGSKENGEMQIGGVDLLDPAQAYWNGPQHLCLYGNGIVYRNDFRCKNTLNEGSAEANDDLCADVHIEWTPPLRRGYGAFDPISGSWALLGGGTRCFKFSGGTKAEFMPDDAKCAREEFELALFWQPSGWLVDRSGRVDWSDHYDHSGNKLSFQWSKNWNELGGYSDESVVDGDVEFKLWINPLPFAEAWWSFEICPFD